MSKQNIPDYFHVGYHKVASTYLQSQVFANLPNGYLNIVADIKRPVSEDSIISASSVSNTGIKDLKLVYSDNRLTGDMEHDNPDLANLVWRINKKAKILICIRSQYTVMRSYYFTLSKNGFYGSYRNFIQHMIKNKKLDYYSTIKAFYECFGKENVTVILYEDFCANPEQFKSKMDSFLDIENSVSLNLDSQVIRKSPSDLAIDCWNLASRVKKIFGLTSRQSKRFVDYCIVSPGFLFDKYYTRISGKKIHYRQWQDWGDYIKRGYGDSNQKLFELLELDISEYGYPY